MVETEDEDDEAEEDDFVDTDFLLKVDLRGVPTFLYPLSGTQPGGHGSCCGEYSTGGSC